MTGAVRPVTLARSFLYVPGNRPELFAKATAGPADAVILDLEDAVPLPDKERARASVRSWLAEQATHPTEHPTEAHRAEQWVRVDAEALEDDLGAVLGSALDGIVLAKCSVTALERFVRVVDRGTRRDRDGERRLGVVGLVESAQALHDLGTMARMPHVTTFGIGEVDLLADLRMARTDRSAGAVDGLRMQVVSHCAAAGLAAPVAPTSTAFRDLEAFAESTRHLQDLGFRSRTAVHPLQVPVIHEVLTPDSAAVAAARDVVERFEAAGSGVTTDEKGRLIDAAVVREARETLSRASRG